MAVLTSRILRCTGFSLMGAAFALCLSCPSGWADELPATSHVTAATIFPDRAIVSRLAKLHVASGAHTIVISDVSAGFDENSLRVQGKADTEVKIGTVEMKRVFLTEAANAVQRDKQAQIRAREDEKQIIGAQIQALQNRRAFIEKLSASGAEKTDASGTTKLDFSPEKWTQAWGLIQTGMDETLKDLVVKNIAERKLDEDIQKLNQELAQIQSTQARERRDIHIQIESGADTDLQLSLNYQTGGASWAPMYDARLDTGTGALAVEQYGQASQQTGEDWTDAEVTLSTTIPSRGSEMPQLGEWVVQLVQQYAVSRLVSPPQMREAPGGAASPYLLEKQKIADSAKETNALKTGGSALPTAAAQADLMEAIPQQAVVQSSEYAAEFRVPGHVDLKSTADSTKLRIGTIPMTATLTSRVTPRLTSQAYLFAKAVNGEKFPLLPGRVAKYRDNAFIGNAMLPILRPGETVQLAFGVDDRVKVSYRRTHEEQSNPTFIVVGDVTIERQYETKIQNLHKDPIDIMVFEQYPIAANPDVQAELEDGVTTAGFARDPDNRQGIITWSANLKPQEEKTYTLGFQVKFPKNEQLTGL